ncbi:hypothetical protein [Rhizobium sp. CNPSo 4039]|uniref:hypothetical protein n=1 Tax=Rhizobium sp. CNPSo 4039 TaxID=3021409 RepID=UPI00254C8D5D|nr:hypothetical protein [Rhizobium sp. CNPSo 4039]MDK4712994.1 hypothetical protein [Rhizobium sp. CNPSo 4039]
MPDDIYVPRDGARLPVPWPEEGRAVNPLNNFEQRLILEGDLVLKPATQPASQKKGQGGDTGGDQP